MSNIFGYGHFSDIGSQGAIEKFIDCLFSNKGISLHGTGKQLVDYLHKSELMNILKFLIQINPKIIYNVSSGKSKSIVDVAKIISKIGMEQFDQKSEISIISNKQLPNSPKIYPIKIMNDYNLSIISNLENFILEMMKTHSQKFTN